MIKLERNREDARQTSERQYYWFLCDCGNKVSMRSDCKKNFCNQNNCEFSERIMHGKSKTPLYGTWEGMRARIYNKNANGYSTYGENGIKICEEWQMFENFEKWSLENGWKKGLTIDRINIEKDYSPDNCRWITRAENTNYQHKDGHGTSKQILLIYPCKTKEKLFSTIKECTNYLFDNNLVKSRSFKTVSTCISKYQNTEKDYFGWTFK